MPKLELTSHERSALRATAHRLHPVVLIGNKGLSDAVLKEIDHNLTAHSLIKVRAGGEDRCTRETLLSAICETLSCGPVHHLGKVFTLYRPPPPSTPATASAPESTTGRLAPYSAQRSVTKQTITKRGVTKQSVTKQDMTKRAVMKRTTRNQTGSKHRSPQR
jgi:RNA-binding protein